MKYLLAIVPVVAVLLVGCGKKDAKPGDWVEAKPQYSPIRSTMPAPQTRVSQGARPEDVQKVVPPPVNLPKLSTLQFDVGLGWNREYLSNENKWVIDKRELKNITRIYVERSPTQIEPATRDAYIKFLQKPDEGGFIWPNVIDSGDLADGFYIVARIRQATDVTNTRDLDTGFVVVRTIGGDRLRFKCHRVLDDATRAEAMEICKAARF